MEGEPADIEANVFGSIDLAICRLAQTHDWDAGVELIEAQVCGGQHLCEHDDLTCVHREVFGDVEDGFEDVDVVALDFSKLKQR